MVNTDFSAWLADAAREAGAHTAGCLRLDNRQLRKAVAENNLLVRDWLTSGRHAQMGYLERMYADKAEPWRTFSFARSVIVLTFSNRWGDGAATHPFPPPAVDAPVGYVSAYAREGDYHLRGRDILAALKKQLGDEVRAAATVDTGAVYERLFATVTGLGIIGANDLLRTPELGTRVFIGCLFVDRELPEVLHEPRLPFACSSCRHCLANCPTAAIAAGRPIVAGKCISYLTIEKPGVLTTAEAATVGDWLFGCDCCTGVCPPVAEHDMRIPVDLDWLLKSPAAAIRRIIRGNAVAYAGVTRLRRNAVAVLKNLNTSSARELLDWTGKNSGSELVRKQIDR